MKKQFLCVLFVSLFVSLISCQKEYSFETGGEPSSGSLQEDVSGECLPKTVQGIYEVGTALVATDNYIEVQVDVTEPGTYAISTNLVNGIRFSANGFFSTAGVVTIKLRGNGTPVADGIHNFTISYDGTECTIPVTILPQGGGDPAVFTLNATTGTCMSTLIGDYAVGVPLGITHKVTLNVSVTTPGTYNITTTTVDGISFSGSGVLTAAGAGTIELTASGSPTSPGTKSIPVTVGTSSCNFDVTVAAAAEFTVDCNSAVINGTYTEGQALTAANTVEVDVTVTTAGVVVLNGTINGMTFAGSATLTLGTHTITLSGSGTPTADGDFDVPLNGSTGSCVFPVTVGAGSSTGDMRWRFKVGATVYEGPTSFATVIDNAGMQQLTINGLNDASTHAFLIAMIKNGTIATGNYPSNGAMPANTSTLLLSQVMSPTPEVLAASGDASTNLVVVLEEYNTTTDVVRGTFSGTAKDGSNNVITISEGTFKATLQ